MPVSADSRLWGCIVVAFSGQEPQPLPADTEARLASFTELAATAIANLDVITIMVIVILTAFAVVLLSAVVDVLYAVLDPRIRLG